MTDIQREKKIQCHVVGHKMPSVTESRGTGRNFLAIYADGSGYKVNGVNKAARKNLCSVAKTDSISMAANSLMPPPPS